MFALVFSFSRPSVLAQQTSITNVSFPNNVLYDLETDVTDPPVIVTATISYTGAQTGYYLQVGVFQLDDGTLADGSGSVNPGNCVKSATSPMTQAACVVKVRSSSGTGEFNFQIRSRPKRLWNLAVIAVLANSSLSLLYDSESDYTFTIPVSVELTLQITVPDHVTVTVDGANRSQGSVRLKLSTGLHNVTIPEIVELGNDTRLRFAGWSDGSTTANRTVLLNHYVDLQALYVTQYPLRITSPSPVSGAGWYDRGTNATFSLNSTMQTMGDLVGLLGGRLEFQGWYDDYRLITTLKNGSIQMATPHSIQARWYANYAVPAALAISVVIITAYELLTCRPPGQSKTKRTAAGKDR